MTRLDNALLQSSATAIKLGQPVANMLQ